MVALVRTGIFHGIFLKTCKTLKDLLQVPLF